MRVFTFIFAAAAAMVVLAVPAVAMASGCFGGMGPSGNVLDETDQRPANTHIYVVDMGSRNAVDPGEVQWLDPGGDPVDIEILQIGEAFGGSYEPSAVVRPIDPLQAGTQNVELGDFEGWDGQLEFDTTDVTDADPPVFSGPLELDARYESNQSSCPDEKWIRATFPFPEDDTTAIDEFAYLVRLGEAPLDEGSGDVWDDADLLLRHAHLDEESQRVSFRIGESMCGCIPPSWRPSEDQTYEIEIHAVDIAGNPSSDALSDEILVTAQESVNGGGEDENNGGEDQDNGGEDEVEDESGCATAAGSSPQTTWWVAALLMLLAVRRVARGYDPVDEPCRVCA